LNYFHFLTQENIGFKLSEIMVGSEIRKKPIPDPGVKQVPDPGSGSATLIISSISGEKITLIILMGSPGQAAEIFFVLQNLTHFAVNHTFIIDRFKAWFQDRYSKILKMLSVHL
jgi:hypothetical protein